MGYRHRFQRCILPFTNSKSVQEVHAFSRPGSDVSVQSSPIWSVHSTHRIYSCGKRSQTACFTKRCKDPPVPRRLVGQSQILPNLSPANTDTVGLLCHELGWLVNREKSELDPKQVVGYQFDLKEERSDPS